MLSLLCNVGEGDQGSLVAETLGSIEVVGDWENDSVGGEGRGGDGWGGRAGRGGRRLRVLAILGLMVSSMAGRVIP